MATLVDTGILLRAFDASFSDYRTIRKVLRNALDDDERLIVTVQNMAEFWNVATRPLDKNGQTPQPAATGRSQLPNELCPSR